MFTLNCRGRLLPIPHALVMGILNVTPDSFYAPSRSGAGDEILSRAEEMINAGASILDIGGQSTRPGSKRVGVEEELARVLHAVEAVCRAFPETIVSIDTYYARVAREAVDRGAALVNDISAGKLDADMWPAVAALNVPYVLMHMQGNPGTMQQSPTYDDIIKNLLDFFTEQLEGLSRAGIHDVILDPGFGFGKTTDHNLEILRNLSAFTILGRPLLAGLSRKSTISRLLDVDASGALNGTTVMNTLALMQGASILRVHDVREAMEAVKIVNAVKNGQGSVH